MDLLPNLIGGRWVAGSDVVENRSPSDHRVVVSRHARGDEETVRDAVQAAQAAAGPWAATGIQDRARILDAIGDELAARQDELGMQLAREEGKTLREATAEVGRAAAIFRFFAGEALRAGGEYMPSTRPGVEVLITREPVGVVGMITPWNFPIAIPAWKLAPALAYGNAVVWKPAEMVPASAWSLADIAHRAGIPAGALNMIVGPGSVVGDAIVASPGISAITFTGSQDVGRGVASSAIGRLAKLQLEMGGKNPLVVVDDADVDKAVHCAVEGSFGSTGQRCTASSRVIVTDAIYERFVSALLQRMATLRVGDAVDPKVDIGPVIDARQLKQDLEYVAVGEEEGAKLAFGGTRVATGVPGNYLTPALFVEATNDMRICREEIFGPVLAAIRVADYDEALAVANDTPFGLTAGLCTTSLATATHFRRNAQAGMVMVNLPTAGVDPHVPFGGRKESSYGPREQGTYAAESIQP